MERETSGSETHFYRTYEENQQHGRTEEKSSECRGGGQASPANFKILME